MIVTSSDENDKNDAGDEDGSVLHNTIVETAIEKSKIAYMHVRR